MKMHNVQAYPIPNVPDHLTHKCAVLAMEMSLLILDKYGKKDPNIFLGAVTFLHASVIKHVIADKREELKKCAELCAIGLLKNVDFLIDLMEKEQNKNLNT